MTNGIASVHIVGNLTRDVELRSTTSGMQVAHFGVAVGQRRGTGEDAKEEAHFFDLTMFGKTGEAFAKFHRKGSRCAIVGRLRYESWEKEGRRQSRVTIVGDTWVFCGDGKQQGPRDGDSDGRHAGGGDASGYEHSRSTRSLADNVDDTPF